VSAVVPRTTSIADAYSKAYAAAHPSNRRPAVPRRPFAPLRAVAYAALGLAIGIALAVTAPLAFGYKSFTVLSGSMEPAIGTGDVIVVKRISPLDARVGDVVSFRDPENASRILSHRVVRIRAAGNLVFVVTKGDANTGVEQWQVPEEGTIGRVEYRIPKLGYVTNRVGSRFGRLAFLVLPALLLAISELLKIWRPEPRKPGSAGRT
jgi:signal peptidase